MPKGFLNRKPRTTGACVLWVIVNDLGALIADNQGKPDRETLGFAHRNQHLVHFTPALSHHQRAAGLGSAFVPPGNQTTRFTTLRAGTTKGGRICRHFRLHTAVDFDGAHRKLCILTLAQAMIGLRFGTGVASRIAGHTDIGAGT
jgi:hypothetical protein